MNTTRLIGTALLAIAATAGAQAAVTTYNVTTTFSEPDTPPKDTIFIGSFSFDPVAMTVSNLKGVLSESMTGTTNYPNDDMTWLTLDHQLSAVYDAGLGGLLVTTFRLPGTSTFTTMYGGDGWSPGTGFALHAGFPMGPNPGNAYARIFVNTSNPLAPLTPTQVDKLAYADCAPGGMMMMTCMTGTTVAGYGTIGSMSGYPVSQTITAAVPEAQTWLLMAGGLGVLGLAGRRRRRLAA